MMVLIWLVWPIHMSHSSAHSCDRARCSDVSAGRLLSNATEADILARAYSHGWHRLVRASKCAPHVCRPFVVRNADCAFTLYTQTRHTDDLWLLIY